MICVQELGLTSQYRDDIEFRRYCAMINGLAFLSLTDVHTGMDVLKHTLPSAAKPLIEYFDETYEYVSGSTRSTAAGARRFRARFPPKVWNVHDATLTNGNRTNNFAEALNQRYEVLVGHSHPTIWLSLETLQADAAEARTMIWKTLATDSCDVRHCSANEVSVRYVKISRQKAYHRRLFIRRRGADSVTTLT